MYKNLTDYNVEEIYQALMSNTWEETPEDNFNSMSYAERYEYFKTRTFRKEK